MSVEIHIVKDEETRERVFRFRYDVHTLELGKEDKSVDHKRRFVTDEADETAIIYYAEKDGEIVGTIRANFNTNGKLPKALQEQFNTQPLEKALGPGKISVAGKFMVDPRMRGQTLASLLMVSLFQHALDSGILVNFSLCELSLVKLYNRLGFRQYQKNMRPDGTYIRVPLVLAVCDYNFLLKVMSPFALSLNDDMSDNGQSAEILAEVYPFFQKETSNIVCDLRTLWADLADSFSRTVYCRPSIFDGLEKNHISFILNSSSKMTFQAGEVIQLPYEVRSGLGIVLKGKIGDGIRRDESSTHWIELFREGDTFGETKVPEDSGRVSELIAIEDAEVALLPTDLIDKAKKTDPIFATRLTMNIISFMQKRLSDLEQVIHVRPPEDEETTIAF